MTDFLKKAFIGIGALILFAILMVMYFLRGITVLTTLFIAAAVVTLSLLIAIVVYAGSGPNITMTLQAYEWLALAFGTSYWTHQICKVTTEAIEKLP